MSLLIIAAIIWCICKLISYASARSRERARQEQLEAIKREQERAKEFRRRQFAEDKERTRRMVEIEREQEKQAKELAKHEAWLVKHDEEIRKLNQTVNRLSAKVEDIELRIVDLEAVKEMNYKKFLEADHAGDDKNKEKYLRKLISIDNQLSAARDSKQAALDKIENAKCKLSA